MKWFYFFIVLNYINCSQPLASTDKTTNQKEIFLEEADSIISLVDTGYCVVNFIVGDSGQYRIEWGNNMYKNISSNNYEVLGNGMLGVEYIDTSIILLRQSCGTSCTYFVSLPLKKKSKDHLFYNPISYDKVNHLLAYLKTEDQPIIEIIDVVENKIIASIKDLEFCPAALKIDCIKDSKFENGNLQMKWEGDKWERSNNDLRTLTRNVLEE